MDIIELELEWPRNFDFPYPGQFVLIRVGDGLTRPFSVAYNKSESIILYIRIVGKNTELIAELEQGRVIYIAGPLGMPFLPIRSNTGYILVGGGMGAAPLLLYAQKLKKIGEIMFPLIGVKDEAGFPEYYFRRLNCGLKVITEKEGLATDLLERTLEDIKDDPTLKNLNYIIITCGPREMLRKIAEIAKKNRIKCYVILEEMMACGVGSCKGCAVFCKKNKVKHVCHDGPVFDADEIDRKKFIPDLKMPPAKIYPKTDYPMRVILKGKYGNDLYLTSPVMNASGCLDIYAIENHHVDISLAGALVTKGVSLHPILGNPTPRICETGSGMINSIGMQNPGIKKFKKYYLPVWLKTEKIILVNIFGRTIDEYAEIAQQLTKTDISGIEINVSCPNVDKGGMLFGQSSKTTEKVVSTVRKEAPSKFISVKITPAVANPVEIAKAAIRGGADYIIAINTFPGMAIDINTRRPKIAKTFGGMSGPGINPMALWIVHQIHEAGIPVIGVGGIHNRETAISMMSAGASAIQIGTGLLSDPLLINKSYFWLNNYRTAQGFSCAEEITGNLIKQAIK